MEPVPQACGIIIFGASGDLTRRKLVPSLATLAEANLLPKNFFVLGAGRTRMTDEQFQQTVQQAASRAKIPADFPRHFFYVHGEYSDPELYIDMTRRLKELEREFNVNGSRLYYLSTPPSLYETISARLGAAGMAQPGSSDAWVRLVVEKPFGRDSATARQLNRSLHRFFQENQIYRIDHYLGKETVQNVLMFRFANAIYEPVWNEKYISRIEITAAEADGVGHRAGYYEQAGVLRDMFQNHLFQLLSLVAMEPPCCFEADAIRTEKRKVIASLKPVTELNMAQSVVRGQYDAGTVNGNRVPGYRQEKYVSPASFRETYAAMRLEIDNWRWQGVPIYLRSGKRLGRRVTEVDIEFKHVPSSIFKPLLAEQLGANTLRFRIQPNEGISLSFEAKHPGPKLCMSTVTMLFDYHEAFGSEPPEAYTRLFLDVMLGDQTLFARQDWVETSWTFLDPVLKKWEEDREKGLHFYPAGGWGPHEADALLENGTWAVT